MRSKEPTKVSVGFQITYLTYEENSTRGTLSFCEQTDLTIYFAFFSFYFGHFHLLRTARRI